LTSIPLRELGSANAAVVSISKFLGGSASNVIPSEVTIEGSTRYFHEPAGKSIPDLFKKVLEAACKGTETAYELTYNRAYIATINDPEIIKECKSLTKQFIGKSSWIDLKDPVMASEDFSYYLNGNPGGMFFLGVGEDSPELHTNTFDFNDEALTNGIKFLVISTFFFLANDKQRAFSYCK
jgi:metal-dependent amidase/aminoacylase/carboxypeptidase family protein